MYRHLLAIIGLLLAIVIIFQAITYRLEKQPPTIAKEVQQNVTVSAFVGDHHFTLYGYSSPRALITFDGLGIYDQTTADDKGYFEFKNRFSPQSPRAACLTAQDQLGRLTSPVCLPPFPTSYDATIGPVIMPPTVSLNNPSVGSDYYVGDEIVLSGQAVPNTDVDLSVYMNTNNSRGINFNIVKPVEAYGFPSLAAHSDAKGNFSVSLPSASAQTFRLFARANWQQSLSPDSIELNLQVMPWWMMIVQFFLLIFTLIKSRLLEVIILTELALITIYLLRRFLHPHVIARNRSLSLRQVSLIVAEKNPLTLAE